MKRIIVSFVVMCSFLFVMTNFVFASYTNLEDSYRWLYSAGQEGTCTLSGRRDNSTDRLSNVKTTVEEVGSVTVTPTVTRPSQYTAKATVKYSFKGIKQHTETLSI